MPNEWKIGKHKVKFDQKTGIIRVWINDDFSADDHDKLGDIYTEAYKGFDGKKYAIINLENATPLSKEVRRSMKDNAEKTMSFVDKTALVGAPGFVRMVAKIVSQFSGDKSSTLKKNEKEALDWFKEE